MVLVLVCLICFSFFFSSFFNKSLFVLIYISVYGVNPESRFETVFFGMSIKLILQYGVIRLGDQKLWYILADLRV